MRKSRSAHVKCDCGEKTSKCAHLQQPVDGHKEAESDRDPLAAAAAAAPPKPPIRRRRANTVHSDGLLSFDQNGNHKPAAKHNRAAQKCGPYQLNRVNSTNSASSLGATSESMLYSDGQAPDSFGHRSRAATAREQRRVKSETTSPLMSSGSFTQLQSGLPPLDLSGIDYPSYVVNGSFEMFSSGVSSEVDGPIFSAGLSAASVDWSHYDLGEAKPENFAPSSYSQAGARSFNGLFEFGSGSEQLPRLANTTSTSGEVSEVEDFLGNGDGDVESCFSTNGLIRPANIVARSTDLASIDYDSFYNKNAENNVAVGTISMVEEDAAFWMPNYNDRITTTVDESPDQVAATSMGPFWEL
ncbi:Copper fist DNA binding domain protein [Metarhizium album ARSEF 1941]|uniref:Copper fist DNA binding domain protein n=1 Tax=Metarhizium album (strain ARSEF 1941) TaxID=1081103 RepID=A0A0B2WZE6_METAS|nr:Copper fist DNA binding domain protein [Metarhizium album ARSEF 1941]KHO01667.1 Copper fist DNA binding domain protein [Metarhizium album ARSEF 1941]